MLRTNFARMLAGGALMWSAAAMAQNAWTNAQVNVRAGPDRTYPVVLRLSGGYPVDVVGCLSGYAWCDVIFNGGADRGWVPSRRLSYGWQGRRVPLYDYRASIGLPIVTFSLLNYWDSYYRGRPWYGDRPRFYNAPHSNWVPGRPEFRERREFREPPRGQQFVPPPGGRPHEFREGRPPEQFRPEGPRRGPPQGQAPQPVPAQPIPAPRPPQGNMNNMPRTRPGTPEHEFDPRRQREPGQN